jgi:hypothetical protein
MASRSLHFENGEQVWPCRCGETHRGTYGQEDWNHHNCLHDATLIQLSETRSVLCPSCGRLWNTED